jgi:uncharacterized protein YjbJ (UPF0337 family)
VRTQNLSEGGVSTSKFPASAKNRNISSRFRGNTNCVRKENSCILLMVATPAVFFVGLQIAFNLNHITTAAFIACDFVFMKSSIGDKIKGAFKEAKGNAKEKAGKAIGNPDLRDRGTMEEAGGKVQRTIGDMKKVFDQ